jgi:predicted DNA-binding transcriptional regulator AlpA
MKPDRVIREKDLRAYDGLGPSQRDKYIEDGNYPPPVKLSNGGRAKAWLGSEVAAYQAWRKAVRDHPDATKKKSWKDYLPEPPASEPVKERGR